MNKNNIVHMSLDEAVERVERGQYHYDPEAPNGPSFPDGFWEDAWVEFPGPKTDEMLRLDRSVVEWFKARHSSGWRQHINEVLHRYVDRQQETASSNEDDRSG